MAAACGDYLGSRMVPAALGFVTLFFGLGQAAGPSVAGALADATGSFGPAFLLAAGVAFLGRSGRHASHARWQRGGLAWGLLASDGGWGAKHYDEVGS